MANKICDTRSTKNTEKEKHGIESCILDEKHELYIEPDEDKEKLK